MGGPYSYGLAAPLTDRRDFSVFVYLAPTTGSNRVGLFGLTTALRDTHDVSLTFDGPRDQLLSITRWDLCTYVASLFILIGG